MYLLVAAQCYTVREQTISGVALVIPFRQERMLTLNKGWKAGPSFAMQQSFAAFWTSRTVVHFDAWWRGPCIIAPVTMPMSQLTAMCKYHGCAATIFGSIPVSCNIGSHGGKGIMLAEFAARALRTP